MQSFSLRSSLRICTNVDCSAFLDSNVLPSWIHFWYVHPLLIYPTTSVHKGRVLSFPISRIMHCSKLGCTRPTLLLTSILQTSFIDINASTLIFIDGVPDAFNRTIRGLCTAATDSIFTVKRQTASRVEKRLNLCFWRREALLKQCHVVCTTCQRFRHIQEKRASNSRA